MSNKTRDLIKKIIKQLFQDVSSIRIRGDTKVVLLIKGRWIFKKRVKKRIDDLLFIDIPEMLSMFTHGNKSSISYYQSQIKIILKEFQSEKLETKIEKIINYLYTELLEVRVVDISNTSLIELTPKIKISLYKKEKLGASGIVFNLFSDELYSIKKLSIAAMLLLSLNLYSIVETIGKFYLNSPIFNNSKYIDGTAWFIIGNIKSVVT